MNKLNPFKAIANSISLSLARRRLKNVHTLTEAVSIAFVTLPPGGEIVGPQGRIKLLRNMLPIGHHSIAEMLVIDNISGKDMFGYSWRKGEGICLQDAYLISPPEWEEKW